MATTSPVSGSTEKVRWSRPSPYWPDWTTGRVRPSGQPSTGTRWAYCWCVCAETIASTSGLVAVAIRPNAVSAVRSAMSVDSAPSCTSSTRTSASPLASSPSDSVVGDPVDLVDDVPDLEGLDAGRGDERGQVLGDGTDEPDGHAAGLLQVRTPAYAGRPVARSYTFAAR